MRKSGLNKIDVVLLKKHLAANTPIKDIKKALKQIDPKAVEAYIESLNRDDKPAAKKAAAKKSNDLI